MGTSVWPDNLFRVFYDIHHAEREVAILAIGIKVRDTVFIGGEAIDL